MSTSKNTCKLTVVPTAGDHPNLSQEVERAAYRAAASVAVLWKMLLTAGDDQDHVTIPAAVLADFVEGIDRELDFVTEWIGSMHVHEGVARAARLDGGMK